jgi:hypothetical protein
MNTPARERRVRPVVMVFVGGLVAALMIPLWIFVLKPAPPPPPPEPEPQAEAAAPEPSFRPAVKPPVVTRVRPSRRSRFAQQAKVEQPAPPAPPPPASLEDKWGIQVCAVRLSMMNSIVDLRYKVLDPEKAVLLADGKTPAYIVEPASGTKLIMPTPPKEGAFPPTANRLAAGKTYFAAVSNQRGLLKSGDVVNVLVGSSLATNLTVQ